MSQGQGGTLLQILVQVGYDLNRSTMHPKLNLTGVRTHDFQIMISTIHVREMLSCTEHTNLFTRDEVMKRM